MKNLTYILLAGLLLACNTTPEKSESKKEVYVAPSHHIDELTKIFEAHGGYEQWSKMKSLSYKKAEENTITNLQNRKIRLESSKQTIGFDGTKVWVAPDSVDASRARFYHNLYFYFYAMPFVVGDPGANYEKLPQKEIDGKNYEGIKVSYNDGVGDAPDDNYIIWVDPNTKEMEWLMYTVTYRSGEPSDRYSLIKYKDWQKFNGLLLPTSLQWYRYENDSVGAPRSEAFFTEISISEEAPKDSLFEMPDGAIIAPLNNAGNE